MLRNHLSRQDGQTMAEYGVVLTVLTLGAVMALGLLSERIRGAIETALGILG